MHATKNIRKKNALKSRIFVRTNWLIFFSFHVCYLFPLNCAIDLQLIKLEFAIDFAIFMWLQTDSQIDGWTNGWTDQRMDGPIAGQYFSLTKMR